MPLKNKKTPTIAKNISTRPSGIKLNPNHGARRFDIFNTFPLQNSQKWNVTLVPGSGCRFQRPASPRDLNSISGRSDAVWQSNQPQVRELGHVSLSLSSRGTRDGRSRYLLKPRKQNVLFSDSRGRRPSK